MEKKIIIVLCILLGFSLFINFSKTDNAVDQKLTAALPSNHHKNNDTHSVESIPTTKAVDYALKADHAEHPHKHADIAHHTINNETVGHTHNINDIKKRLCVDTIDEYSCTIDLNININDQIIDTELELAKSKEIGVLLASDNFDEVLSLLETSRSTSTASDIEHQVNNSLYEINNTHSRVITNGIKCSDVACAASFTYQNEADWLSFKQVFLKSDLIGNIFTTKLANETRILFLPNNRQPIIK